MAEKVGLKLKLTKEESNEIIKGQEIISVQFIDQSYLFASNSFLTYDHLEKEWGLHISQAGIPTLIPVKAKMEEYAEIEHVLKPVSEANLVANDDLSVRIRRVQESNMSTSFEFHVRKLKECGSGYYKFEYPVDKKNFVLLNEFLEVNDCKVTKTRYNLEIFGKSAKLDTLIRQDYDVLVFKFDTLDEKLEFLKNDIPGEDVTLNPYYSNREVALRNCSS